MQEVSTHQQACKADNSPVCVCLNTGPVVFMPHLYTTVWVRTAGEALPDLLLVMKHSLGDKMAQEQLDLQR